MKLVSKSAARGRPDPSRRSGGCSNEDEGLDCSSSAVDSDILVEDDEDSSNRRRANDDDDPEAILARAETNAVRRLRILVLLVLVLSAVGVAVAVYTYTSRSEQDQFQEAFEGNSRKVLEGIGTSLERTLGSLDAMQTHLVTWARATNQTWPFVTIPHFYTQSAKIKLLSDVGYIMVNPLVTKDNRQQWEAYAIDNQGWVNESMKVQATDEASDYHPPALPDLLPPSQSDLTRLSSVLQFYYGPVWYNHSISPVIHGDYGPVPDNATLMIPTWQSIPAVTRYTPFSWDWLTVTNPEPIKTSVKTHKVVMTQTYGLPDPKDPAQVAETELRNDWYTDYFPPGDTSEPSVDVFYPVIDYDLSTVVINDSPSVVPPPQLVAILTAGFFWRDTIKNLLPPGTDGVVVVFSGGCSPSFTYQIDGENTTFLGRGDLHETSFDSDVAESSLHDLSDYFIRRSQYTGIPLDQDYCPRTVAVYPSTTMQVQYITNNPMFFTIGAVLIFVFTSAVFLLYDFSVERRQKKVMTTAVRTNAIVSSLFPSVVRDRIYPTESTERSSEKKSVFKLPNSRSRLKSFLNDGNASDRLDDPDLGAAQQLKTAPIAELFPDATVLFADIAGFTAWSSVRDPIQVFTLLETLYGAFDALARRRGVFKVETIGDSYVAVCGLPEPRDDHAVVMARFARDCRDKMNELTRELEKSLGPDTGDLKLRFGLNSGPVTAGVLRGERSRFQLFGDTVNCASRMESNGKPNLIQVSQKTADLLMDAGKGHWLKKRDELIEAKGKGTMQTYWVNPPSRLASTVTGGQSSETSSPDSDTLHVMGLSPSHSGRMTPKLERLIDWNFETFARLLKKIVARRMAMGREPQPQNIGSLVRLSYSTTKPRSEVVEVITFPGFDGIRRQTEPFDVDLNPDVLFQLRDFITSVAYMYRDNAFHNFEHASHVAFSAMKLLQRVTAPEASFEKSSSKRTKLIVEEPASSIHSSEHRLTSDPLTQFAIAFAALVHDVDHPGVPNQQLVVEQNPMALLYDNESVAEQNSVSISWQLLMRPCYVELRDCLFANESDLRRFRQLVVNSVIATDIFDPVLKTMRESRWDKAFAPRNEESIVEGGHGYVVDLNRKATIAIEHLIQASDVSHTMQHWTIYQKWNERLFREMYLAFLAGRSASNPADGWYQGELWFFDEYVIPLAKKLKDCHVFGVACDEFLDYASDNRAEWEAKGEATVKEMLERIKSNRSAEDITTEP